METNKLYTYFKGGNVMKETIIGFVIGMVCVSLLVDYIGEKEE